MESPEKAVGLPMLRQQLVDAQDRMRGDFDNIHGEIARLYTMLQWFLGLMIPLIVAVGGMVLSTFKGPEKPAKQDPTLAKENPAKA